ncbi:hypothetical protein [Acinetobacter genomosp. 15BJ]|uniref:Lipoprotein n=1 Tax=Acinetobacter genomosp. 15BJ TaxID=106651 RepID=R9B3Q4_9GAMM|nr:hypothetical protein [Acinetobacter genomosp. 15BJ]EOR08890.1 hypothetical protein F896_01422 [Acinetobacter genomosp. 15BJ]MCH7293420.1 hypothetical protein [Acinetobacter genomosp. 15BJ]MDO3658604.1 hypothetical protein [Acinetobacter genomosp. 15BJ]
MKNIDKIKNLSIGLIAIFLLFGCKNSQAKYQEKFIAHVAEKVPAPYKECMLNFLKENWDEAWKTYNNEKKREPRGEADIVNFMIEKYIDQCKKEK